MPQGISEELRRKGVAASTIREALGPWVISETERVIATLAKTNPTLPDLLAIQADAKVLYRLKKELEGAMELGGLE